MLSPFTLLFVLTIPHPLLALQNNVVLCDQTMGKFQWLAVLTINTRIADLVCELLLEGAIIVRAIASIKKPVKC